MQGIALIEIEMDDFRFRHALPKFPGMEWLTPGVHSMKIKGIGPGWVFNHTWKEVPPKPKIGHLKETDEIPHELFSVCSVSLSRESTPPTSSLCVPLRNFAASLVCEYLPPTYLPVRRSPLLHPHSQEFSSLLSRLC